MLLHRAPHPTEEQRSRGAHPVEQLHELPELPEGAVIPDDLRGLEPPTAPTSVHWLRWIAVVAVALVATAIVLLVRGTGGTEQAGPSIVMSPAAQIIQDEIEHALNEQAVLNGIFGYHEDLAARTG